MKEEITIQRVENDDAVVELKDNGIICVFIKSGVHITVETQRGFIEMYHQVTEIHRPYLFEGGEFVTVSREAIDNAITMEKNAPLTASAILVKNLGQKIIADFYYKIKRPSRPLKVFRSREAAIIWLEKYK